MKRWINRFELKSGVWVYVPTEEMVAIGHTIKNIISDKFMIPQYYYQFQKGGHLAAIQIHLDNTYFVQSDLKNFFGNISRTRIVRSLKKYFSFENSWKIAELSVVQDPNRDKRLFTLPFGFIQSPVLAALCLHESKLGKYLQKVSFCKEVSISVYVDDIIFSGKDAGILASTLSGFRAAAYASKFPINEDKTIGPTSSFEAFNIEYTTGNLYITEERMKKFALALLETDNTCVQKGIINYVQQVNTSQAGELLKLV